MVVNNVKEWVVTISLARTLKFPVEEGEDEEIVRAWLGSTEGCDCIKADFTKGMQITGYHRNTDIEVVEIELKETEVKSTDTDPRV